MARVDRRGFLRAGGQAAVAAAGILGGAPASWAARELNILTAVNYAPTSDLKLAELVRRVETGDVKEVVIEYLSACREKGILEVRVVHGKGIGQLRQTVHALLRKHPDVVSFDLAGEAYGGSGATFVRLRPVEAKL